MNNTQKELDYLEEYAEQSLLIKKKVVELLDEYNIPQHPDNFTTSKYGKLRLQNAFILREMLKEELEEEREKLKKLIIQEELFDYMYHFKIVAECRGTDMKDYAKRLKVPKKIMKGYLEYIEEEKKRRN
jgi:hypothetical protein